MAESPSSRPIVLLADDDPNFGSIVQRFLAKEEIDCELVPDSATALLALAAKPYHLLIADIDMPGNRGLEMVQKLVEISDRPPVILMTGSPTIATATKSVGLAVFAYLTKPCDADELRRLVHDAIAHGRIRHTVAASERRVRAWAQDLAKIRELVQRGPNSAEGVQSYLSVTVGNLMAAVNEFAEVAELMARNSSQKEKLEKAALVGALHETITVIESTRHLFKSKELGALRRKLEDLVR